ncbi:hypothetical protein BT69DRAFT_1285695 [Atractiella rhizophila]|nr:hypothetical protein BT69DRAFT_1285695 [Atractiella rhizophila]
MHGEFQVPPVYPARLVGKSAEEITQSLRLSYWKALLSYSAREEGFEETARIFHLALGDLRDAKDISKYLFQSFNPDTDRRKGETALEVLGRLQTDMIGPSYRADPEDVTALLSKFSLPQTNTKVSGETRESHSAKLQDAIYLYDHAVGTQNVLKDQAIASDLLFSLGYLWDDSDTFEIPSSGKRLSRWEVGQMVYRHLLQTSIENDRPLDRESYYNILNFSTMAGAGSRKVSRHTPTPLMLAKSSRIDIEANPEPLTGTKKDANDFAIQVLHHLVKEGYYIQPQSSGSRTNGKFVRAMMKAVANSYSEAWNAYLAIYVKEKKQRELAKVPLDRLPVFTLKEYNHIVEYLTSLRMEEPPSEEDMEPKFQSGDWQALLGLKEVVREERETKRFVCLPFSYLEEVLEHMSENGIVPDTYFWTLWLNHYLYFIPEPTKDSTLDLDVRNHAFDGIHNIHRLARAHRGYTFDNVFLFNLMVSYARFEVYEIIWTIWSEIASNLTPKDLPAVLQFFRICAQANAPDTLLQTLRDLPAWMKYDEVLIAAVSSLCGIGHWLSAAEVVFSQLGGRKDLQKECMKVMISASADRDTEEARASHKLLKELAIDNGVMSSEEVERFLEEKTVRGKKRELKLLAAQKKRTRSKAGDASDAATRERNNDIDLTQREEEK